MRGEYWCGSSGEEGRGKERSGQERIGRDWQLRRVWACYYKVCIVVAVKEGKGAECHGQDWMGPDGTGTLRNGSNGVERSV